MTSTRTPNPLRTPLAGALSIVLLAACASPAPRADSARAAPATAAPVMALANVPMVDDAESARLAERVREETRHAWQGYMRYARGHDDLAPLSNGSHDWYAHPLLMTPVDALDTLLLMGLDKEADEARALIVERLSFDRDMDVQNFEITIRLLGGLQSSYQLTHDKRLLALAEDLGRRLLPVFDSPTGLPYTHVNLRTGKISGKVSNPAETGTLLLEFGMLSKLTGNPVYYDKAKRALVATFERRSKIGLVGAAIDVETGRWTDTTSHVSGGIDSYLEYLFKCWRLFGDEDCKRMWEQSIGPVDRYLADEVRDGELWYGYSDMDSGARTETRYGALDAFLPGLLAVSGDLDRAKRLQESGLTMWRLHGIEPETLDYRTLTVTSPAYMLRPEIIESAWYLHRLTGDARYRGMGKEFFEDFVRSTRTASGFAALKDVTTKTQEDSMQSFVFAETLKYFWLLFSPREAIDFDAVTFNTEAHLLRMPEAAH